MGDLAISMKIGDLAIDSILIGDLALNKILRYKAADFITIGDQARVCNVLRWDHIQWNYCSQKRIERWSLYS